MASKTIKSYTHNELLKIVYSFYERGLGGNYNPDEPYEQLESQVRFLSIEYPELFEELDVRQVVLPKAKPRKRRQANKGTQKRRDYAPTCQMCDQRKLKGKQSRERGICSYCYYKTPEGKKDTSNRVMRAKKRKQQQQKAAKTA